MRRKQISLIALVVIILLIFLIIGVLIIWKINNYNETKTTLIEGDTENSKITDYDYENDQFTISFLQMEDASENIIYSPLSIKYALKMLEEGASGNTYRQIKNVIESLDLTTYSNVEDILSFANGLFVRKSYYKKVYDDYIETLQNNYNADVISDEFKSAENINKWIEEKTLGLIPNMLSDEAVGQANLLLVNALGIEMDWYYQFDDDDTIGRSFYLEDETEIKATTMYKRTASSCYSYYIDNNVTVLTMDLEQYENTQLEFMAIMPEENLSDYIENLKTEDIDNISENLQAASDTEYGLIIYIPKFSFDYELDLKNDLKTMGITDIFNSNADFSNMAKEDLYVSDVIHKSTVEFSEEGIKAAAVTAFPDEATEAADEGGSVVKYEPIIIRIDKPFLFLIRDKETNEVWFVGAVYEPNLWKDDMVEYGYYSAVYIDENQEEETSDVTIDESVEDEESEEEEEE